MVATRCGFMLVMAGCAIEAVPAPAPPSQLFITDYDADAIVRFDGATGAFREVFAAGDEQRVDRPASVRLGPDGRLYAAGFGRGDIVRYDVDTGAMMDVFYWDTRLLEEPVELAFVGDLLIALGHDTANAVVIAPDGRAEREFGYPTMRDAHDFVFGFDGTLYVATASHPQLGSAIQVWEPSTGTLLRHFGTLAEVARPTGLAIDAHGLLYACDYDRDRVVRFDPSGVWLDVVVERGLRAPVALDLGPDGRLYVLDADGLHAFDPDTGADRGLFVRTGEHLEKPAGFRFVTEHELARTR